MNVDRWASHWRYNVVVERGIHLLVAVMIVMLAIVPTRSLAQDDTTAVVIVPQNALQVAEIGVLRGHAPGEANHIVGARMTPDGQTVVSASLDNTIRAWNVSDGKQRNVFTQIAATSMTLSPDGQHVAYGMYDGQVVVIEMESGQTVSVLSEQTFSPVYHIAYSPDGSHLAFTSVDNTIVVWDFATGTNVTLTGHEGEVSGVALSPDGTRMASVSYDGTIRLWDVENGQMQLLETTTERNNAVAFSPDGAVIAVGCSSGLQLHDATTGVTLAQLSDQGQLEYLAFSPDSQLLAAVAGYPNQVIQLWDVENQTQLKALEGHEGLIHDVSFSPDGTTIVSGGDDDVIRLWGVPVGSPHLAASSSMDKLEIMSTLPGEGERFSVVAFSPDSSRVAAAGIDQPVMVYLIDTGAVLFQLEGHTQEVYDLAFSPDGRYLATASRDDTVMLWDMGTGQLVYTFGAAEMDMRQVVFSPDSTRLYSIQLDKVIVWETETGVALPAQELLLGDDITDFQYLWAFALSPDGAHSAMFIEVTRMPEEPFQLQIWDVATHAVIANFPVDQMVHSLAFSPDGTRLVAGLENSTSIVLDPATGATELTLIGHSDMVTDVQYSPDNSLILSAGLDQVIVWDAATGAPLVGLEGTHAAAFSPDGTLIATLDFDLDEDHNVYNVVHLWRLPE